MALRARIKSVRNRLDNCRKPERPDLVLLQRYTETLDQIPSLECVQPCDTDPATYASIQEMVLYLLGDLEGARAVAEPFRKRARHELMPSGTPQKVLTQMIYEDPCTLPV